MNQHNLDLAMSDIKEKIRVYRVFSYSQKHPIYKMATCKKNRNDILDTILDTYSHERGLRITENDVEIYKRVREKKKAEPSVTPMDIFYYITGDIYESIEEASLKSGKTEKWIRESLRKSARGKSSFKLIK